ncbi:MAG: hypothetical protein V3571_15900 [Pseudodesulfovibrio sp.]
MRTIRKPAAAEPSLPFEGLGISPAQVRAAAREMRPVHGEYRPKTVPPIPFPVSAPVRPCGGYQRLVAQGREIRGR